MFVVARLKDTIKVLPRDLCKPAADILAIAINSKYGNKARRRWKPPTRADTRRSSPAWATASVSGTSSTRPRV